MHAFKLLNGWRNIECMSLHSFPHSLAHIFIITTVDIHDGGVEPVIDKTLTSKISFRDVCETVAKCGFVVSDHHLR